MAGRPKAPPLSHIHGASFYADKIANMVQSREWGRAFAEILRVSDRGKLHQLPLGTVRDITKLYMYLDADAVVFINDQPLQMQVTKQGFWELLADVPVHSLGIRTEVSPASGKFVIFGS